MGEVQQVQSKGVKLSDAGAHEARAKLLKLSAMQERIRKSQPNLENIAQGSRGQRATTEAQKRAAEWERSQTQRQKIDKLKADIDNHEKQSRLHAAEAKRKHAELKLLMTIVEE